MDPQYATDVVTLGKQASEEETRSIREEMERNNSYLGLAEIFAAHSVIAPQDTRRYLIEELNVQKLRRSRGIGRHRLANWPTTY